MTMDSTKMAENEMGMSNDRPNAASKLVEPYSVETVTAETVENGLGDFARLPGGIE